MTERRIETPGEQTPRGRLLPDIIVSEADNEAFRKDLEAIKEAEREAAKLLQMRIGVGVRATKHLFDNDTLVA
jgi:hypothetical protein